MDGIAIIQNNTTMQPLYGKMTTSLPIALNKGELLALSKGKTLIFEQIDRRQNLHILMAQKLDDTSPSDAILMAEINKNAFLNIQNELPKNDLFCLINTMQHNAFLCSTGTQPEFKTLLPIKIQNTLTGTLSLELGKNSYHGVFWRLLPSDNIVAPDWSVVLTSPSVTILMVINNLDLIFPFILLLSLLIIVVINSLLIYRILGPLQRLKEGILALSTKRDHQPVIIKSGDEFEELAVSFNAMAEQIINQFNSLETLANIDRMILSTVDINKIVAMVISRPLMSNTKTIGIIILDKNNSQKGQLFYKNRQLNEISHKEIQLAEDDLPRFSPDKKYIMIEEELPSFLSSLFEKTVQRFLLFPIFIDQALSAIIIMSFAELPENFDASIKSVRDLADRMAVALSNELWEDKLYHQAHYDKLTNTPNRLLLQAKASDEIERAKRNNSSLAVLFLNIDRFKNINESLGHEAGDFCLKKIAERLQSTLRKSDTLSRLGADEFVILVSDLYEKSQLLSYLSLLSSNLNLAISEPIVIGTHEIKLTASIGIAIYPEDGKIFNDLFKNAEAALHKTKSLQSGQYLFYSKDFNAQAIKRLEMEGQMNNALKNDEFIVYYQPKIDVKTHQISGAEALIRWNRANTGIVSPLDFIPLAEETGLIFDIGEFVIMSAYNQAKIWREKYKIEMTISVNLSAAQFQDHFLQERITRILPEKEMRENYISFEITEGSLMKNVDHSIALLNALKNKGIKFEIDDFGTGYSSLSYLKRFPISSLKIDQSFVRDLATDENDAAIVIATIQLGHSLNLKVVAEGVETQEQLNFITQHGGDTIQGYYYSKPLPADKFSAFIENWNKKS